MALTEKSYLWTTGTTNDGATTFTQADLAEAMRILAACNNSVGVAGGYLNAFAATIPGANAVQIDTGAAIVDGKPYSNLGAGNVAIVSAVGGGNTRIDRIVLRADWANHQVRITRIAGTDAASPAAPAITQTPGTTYDVKLFQVTVNTSGVVTVTTDERVFAQINALNQIADVLITAAKIAAATITGAKIAANTVALGNLGLNSVDDTIAGDRVPQFYRRQGSDASDWSAQGSSGFTPTAVRMQGGVTQIALIGANSGSVVVTFPTAFSNKPFAVCTIQNSTTPLMVIWGATTATTLTIACKSVDGTVFTGAVIIQWLAIGPE